MKPCFGTLFYFILLVSLVCAEGQINIAYSPYTISQSGSYIVVSEITTAPDLNAITIATSNVTIDLNGHTLYGPGGSVGSTGFGIIADSTQNNITISNGVVRNFRWDGIVLGGRNIQITKVKSVRNGYVGIQVNENAMLKQNIMEGNSGSGAYILGSGCTVTDNIFSSNSSYGIYVQYGSRNNTITNNIFTSNATLGIRVDSYGYCVIQDNILRINGTGMDVSGSYCNIVSNISDNNSATGIEVSSLFMQHNLFAHNLVINNNTGIDGSFALGNYYHSNSANRNSIDYSINTSFDTIGTGDLKNVSF